MNSSARPFVRHFLVMATACVAIASLPPGCAYQFGPAAGVDGAWELETRSMAVPIFDNKSYRHGLEFELTRYFVEELQLRAPVSIVAEEEEAEAVARGVIFQVRDRVRQEDPNDQVVVSQVELTVDLVLEYRDGRRVGPLRHVEVAEYSRIRNEDRQTATSEVLRDMARELVLRIGRSRAENGELEKLPEGRN